MDGLRTAFTVTPILSGIIVLSIASDPAQTQAGAVAQVLGGAMTGATLSAIVEYSLNKCEHSTETKIQIISANAGVGGAGVGGRQALSLVASRTRHVLNAVVPRRPSGGGRERERPLSACCCIR